MTAELTTLPKGRRKNQDPIEHLASEIRRLHDCVHQVGGKVDVIDGKVCALDDKVDGVCTEVAYLRGRQDTIATRIGVPQEGKATRRGVAFMEGWKFWAAVFGVVTAAVSLYPLFWQAITALHAILLGAAQ